VNDRMTPFPSGVDAVAPEREIARDLAVRTVIVAPVMIAVGAIFWGWHGVWSSGYALAIVAANFLLGAAAITWGAKFSPAILFGAVMFGFLARLGIITAAVLPIRNSEWFEIVPFAISLLVTHLGLLTWEARHVAASLAFPGLKPGTAVLSTNDSSAERSA
jgi:hypothetical protein